MTTTAPTHEQQASDFAASVREHLADLPEVELEELLDGLQADLTERLDDDGELGDPADYADELRQAAGLPARGETSLGAQRWPRRSMRERWLAAGARIVRFWEATPGRRAIRDFVLSLGPVWWVVRGLVLAQLLLVLFGRGIGRDLDPLSFATMLALVVVSVQWGRGLWAPKSWIVGLRRVVSVVAVVLLLPIMSIVGNALSGPVYIDSGSYPVEGLQQNGSQISNIFAFDCSGQPLDGVQLFDQNGQPITTLQGDVAAGAEPMWGFDEKWQKNIAYARNGLAGYSGMWNVFPLQEGRAGLDEDLQSAKMRDATWPRESVLPLSPACAPTDGVQPGWIGKPDTEQLDTGQPSTGKAAGEGSAQ